jgi:hypothetical protein
LGNSYAITTALATAAHFEALIDFATFSAFSRFGRQLGVLEFKQHYFFYESTLARPPGIIC